MATDQARKTRQSKLTPEQEARVEAIRARNRTPEARTSEAQERETLKREYLETGTPRDNGRRNDHG